MSDFFSESDYCEDNLSWSTVLIKSVMRIMTIIVLQRLKIQDIKNASIYVYISLATLGSVIWAQLIPSPTFMISTI